MNVALFLFLGSDHRSWNKTDAITFNDRGAAIFYDTEFCIRQLLGHPNRRPQEFP